MNLTDFPPLVFALSLVVMAIAAAIGDALRSRVTPLKEDERSDFGVVIGATLTLLGLLIGFSFSMAVSRYDQRKNYEEAEANAIGTEYVRADLLPVADAGKARQLLKKYLDQRILFYTTRNRDQLAKINAATAELQNNLWSAVLPGATAQPTPVVSLAVSGMNDVLNSQGYTQAAWWNRIPIAAWTLMSIIAICCNLLIGYGAHRRDWRIFLIVPVAVSIAFFLIADIDSPRGGVIRVKPQDLESLSQSLHAQ
jgi:Ca2+/Na+ antiporter